MGKFRLASVLRVREQREQIAKEDFALTATREREHDETIDRAKHLLSSKFGAIPGPVQNMKAYAASRQASMDQLDRMQAMSPQIVADRVQAQQALLEASQAVKAVEKLQEKHLEREAAEADAAAEAEVDEIVMSRPGGASVR